MFIRVDTHQRQFEFAGNDWVVHLTDEDRGVGIEGRVMDGVDVQGVVQLQAIQPVYRQGRQGGFDEAQAGDDGNGDIGLVCGRDNG